MIDPLSRLRDYNPNLTISQVVKYFERQGMPVTKPMIQHYVRVGLLPPPAGGRYYVEEHMRRLVLIGLFRNAFGLEEIKRLLDGLGPGMETVYPACLGMMERAAGMAEEMRGILADSLPDGIERTAGGRLAGMAVAAAAKHNIEDEKQGG